MTDIDEYDRLCKVSHAEHAGLGASSCVMNAQH